MISGRRLALGLAGVMASAVVLAWAVGLGGRPDPTLEPITRLASSGDFDAAEAALGDLLRAYPHFDDAHLLEAQLRLDRPEPPTGPGQRPDSGPATTALEHLAQVGPGNPNRDALVCLYRGKADYRLARLDKAEASWLDALRINPTVPEAGWCLLEMYYLEGRTEQARALALKLHEAEPDPRDRVQFLLELLRQDAQVLAPDSVVQWFEPAARQAPDDFHVGLALGLALARTGHSDRGLDLLGRLAHEHPDRADAWNAWLVGLDDAGEVERLEDALRELPEAMAQSPRFARHQARVAQERSDFRGAIEAYRRALSASPHDQVVEYRLARTLRAAGDLAEAERIERDRRDFLEANKEVRPLYEEANAVPNLGVIPRLDIYRKAADLRERMGFPQEARAWNRLILRHQPGDPPSVAAIARLGR